jgi:signal transduction histidine kinase
MLHRLLRATAGFLVAVMLGAAAATSLKVVAHGRGFDPASSSGYGVVALVAVGVLLAGAGLVLYVRQPTWTSWALLPVVAGGWWIAEWASPGAYSPWVFSTGLALSAVVPALVCHLALAFPRARPTTAALLAAVAAGYLVSIVLLGIAPATTYAPRSAGCLACPQNFWLIRDDDATLTAQWTGIGLVCAMLWSGAVVGLLGWRLARSSPARRRITGPVQLAGLVYLLLVLASYTHGLRDGYPGSDPTFEQLWFGQVGALALLALAIPFGLAVDRRAYRSMARLSLTLGSTPETGGLAGPLRSRLHDPGLTIIYPHDHGHIDSTGSPVDLRSVLSNRVATPLTRDGAEVATIVHRPGILDSPDAISDLFAATHLALENERLHAIALAQLAELHSTGRRLVTAGDEARSLLERDLHDGAQQRLIGIALGLRMLRSMPALGKSELDAADNEMRAAIDDLRVLARGLYPAVLRESGLRAALIALSERRLVRVHDVPTTRFPPEVEATAYLLVLRTSAAAPVTVNTATTGAALTVTAVLDDHAEGLDLGEVRDRAIALEGRLTQTSTHAGTQVALTLPLPSPRNA